MNENLCDADAVNEDELRKNLGERIRFRRLHMYGTVEKARAAASVSRGTWDNAEKGAPVKSFSMAAIEKALDWPEGYAAHLLSGGDPANWPDRPKTVGGWSQDAGRGTEDHVNAPGETVEAGITNEDLLREIVRSRAEFDQIRAEITSVSERVARLEQRGS